MYGSRSARVLAVCAVLLAAAGTVFAANPKDKSSPLDAKEFFRPELYISSTNMPLADALPQLANRGAWDAFMASRAGSGGASAFIDPRSGAATNILGVFPLIPGNGAGNAVTLETLSRQLGRQVRRVDESVVAEAVARFVRAHAEVLGIDAKQLGEVRAKQANPDLWHVSIPQSLNGVPVRHGRVAAAISHGNLVVVGTEVWGNAAIETTAHLDEAQALDAGFAFADGRSPSDLIVRKPVLEIVPFAPPEHQNGEAFAGPIGSGYGHRLVWSFWFQREPEHAVWEVMVDAVTGEVIAFQDKNNYVSKQATGGVYPLTNTEICPTPETCGIMQTGWPMPWANTGLPAPNDFTNSAGIFEYTSGTVTSTLNGKFVRVTDTCGPISLSSTTGDLAFGGTNGQHDCTTPGIGGAGNTPASRACFYEVGKIKEQARGWLPANAWLNQVQVSNVNLNSTCNAFYSPGAGTINFYRSGNGCGNTGEIAAVFDHEWGHALDDNDTGGSLSNSSEGYADIAGIYRLQASCVGHGFFRTLDDGCGQTQDGTGFNANEAQQGALHCDLDCSGVRDADWAKHNPNTPDTALGFVCTSCLASSGPCGRQVHCAAAPTRQAAWDLVARDLRGAPFNLNSETAFLIGNKLFYQGSGNIGLWHSCTCGGTSDGCGATNGYMQWLTADDDNGNLTDGTPHMTALHAAFNRHGIACNTPTPANSGCAGGPSTAPTVTASPGNNQVSLSWTAVSGATRYWVFRTEGHNGCNLGKALIAEVTGLSYVDTQVANGRPYSYNVVAAGASSACYSPASTCQTVTPVSAPGPTNLVATASAPNTISLTWTVVPGAASYRVYRAQGACPQPAYAQIANNVATNSYSDTTVSGGITYSYVVTWVDASNTESGFSNCDDATATGACTLPPQFAGVDAVVSAGTQACALNVSWLAATPVCPATTVKYNVYRSLTPGFTPSAANLRQSCVNGLTFSDDTVQSGTRYYYKVRAEDNSTNGSGLCNSGVEDTNTTEKSAVAAGLTTSVTDDVESGATGWSTSGGQGTNLWAIVTTQSHSPTHAWFVADPATVSLQPLTRTTAFTYGPGGGRWSWWHRFNTESTFDGYVAEYSLDGGTTWSDILAAQGPVPANANRFVQNGYNATLSTGFNNPLPGRRAWSGDNAAFQEVIVDMNDFAGRDVTIRWRFGSDSSVSDVGVWIDDITFSSVGSCTTVPTQAVEAQGLAVDTSGNGVLDLAETAVVAPSWRNVGSQPISLTGAASNFTGPAGPVYTIVDGTASYGTIGVSSNATCATGGDCYSVSVTGTRPQPHVDGTMLETVTPTSTTKTWTLHVGGSFTDIAGTSPFYRFVETLLHEGVTGGCGADTYCPSSSTTREQMAVFVLVAKEGAGYSPAACVPPNLFSDVPESSPFCRFIEELATRNVVTGCGTNLYCPSDPVTREQMAIFVLRTLDGTINPPACVAGAEMFDDVPSTSPFCRWIEELARRGVVTGCTGTSYCPTDPVTREQMGVFLSVTFGLSLYGL